MLSLGLDISTSRTGYSIIENKKILDFGYIDSSKEEDIYSKAKFVIDKLNQLISNWSIDKINIEDNLQAFSIGRTSANIIIKLAKINAIVSFHLYSNGYEVIHINPSAARKKVFGIIKKDFKLQFKDNKRWIVYLLLKMYGKDLYQKLPKNRKGFLSKNSYDICDSIVVGLY